ncbi:zinc-binding alcohol dehydrogenase (plasmid) [Sphingomonas panacis]|uniref:Zinc-binding alcohol dehydrogenase n=2 Tax=Sphingomonas panacis TaxID=1560345 RepID=A0A1B3ZIR6_9SPHN|nr:zinc-binding alcohol dehydrogenase [Sphingomonas panacis]
MRAVVMQSGDLSLAEFPIPQPGPREVLVKTLACGICGSDLHCAAHGRQLLSSAKEVAGIDLFGFDDPVIMGHEICAEVLEYGPNCRKTLSPGTRAVSAPFLLRPEPVSLVFGTPQTPGGYAEYMLLSEDMLIPVPQHLPSDLATLAEPLAVALHAVNRGKLGANDVPIVIGCGPIGLAVIAVLKMRGIGPIVAADFSPSRRRMAKMIGADVVVDPRETSPYDSWRAVAAATDLSQFGRQTQMFPGHAFRPSVVFECVGIPGIIQQILAGAAPCSKIVVAGLCMELDKFYPSFAIIKEVDIVFCIAFAMDEYAEAFDHIASGKLDAGALITSHVGLEGVPEAFARLKDPERDAKIVVIP